MEQPEIDWRNIKNNLIGLTEDQAEEYLMILFGFIPCEWNDPIFRDEIRGRIGDAEHNAHMNWGENTYGDDSRQGDNVSGVWYHRNIWMQGHPATENWLNHETKFK